MAERAEKEWWNEYAGLESRIWNYNRFLSWVVRRGYLKEMVEFLYRPGGRVLDVGCGDGWVGLLLAQKGMHLDGIDLSEAQIELAERRVRATGLENAHFWCASTADLAQGTRYESVIVHAVLHHLDQKQRQDLLKQMGALLAPGGRLYMYEPIMPPPSRPLSARFLDRGMGSLMRFLKRLTMALRLTEDDIRQAAREGWTMRSPNEAPIALPLVESELPPGLELRRVRYWHVCSTFYANFCMELKPSWQAIFSPGAILFYGLDQVAFGLGIGQHTLSWPMAAIMIEKTS